QRHVRFHESAAAVLAGPDHHVLEPGGGANQPRGLERACDALRGTRVWRAGPQWLAAQEHLALLWCIVPGDHVERGGLTAAVGTNQAVHLAGPDLQGKVVDRANAAEAQRHAL